MATAFRHVPVLLQEVLDHLQPKQNQSFIDGTLGGGGHAAALLAKTGPHGKVLGFELDQTAREAAQAHCAKYGTRLVILPQSYARLTDALKERPEFQHANGLLLDLGLSSAQLDTSGRGFSFKDTGNLDMRFDPLHGVSASDLIMNSSEHEIRDILRTFGEVREATRIARAIVRLRDAWVGKGPLSVPALVETILTQVHRSKPGIHPATQVFQALRIAVNHELESIALVLPQAVEALAKGGRLAVISYHSLEDRIVKEYFKRESKECLCPPNIPVCRCGHRASMRIITRKPIRPSPEELRVNPRSRSARLRVAEKC
jgi:16S rRNA (cytosine1402-N4)-methyltransferase